MIIDVILDRRGYEKKDGDLGWWNREHLRDIYDYAMEFGFHDLARAVDGGTEQDIRRELCRYIDTQKYNPGIKKYIRSVKWLPEGEE